MGKTFFYCLIFTLFAWSGAVSAHGEAASNDQNKAISHLRDALGLSVLKTFSTRDPNLKGYVVKDGSGRTGIIFGVGPYFFSGPLIDRDGNDVSRRFAREELPGPDYEKVAKKLARDPYLISEGHSGAPNIYIFADPNCIFCHKLWQQTRDWVAAGKVQLHWVMVGVLKASSASRAAAVLAAKDRVRAMKIDEQGFDVSSEEGGIKPLSPIPPKIQQVLSGHDHLMAKLGFNGTPALLFKNREGHWQGVSGLPNKKRLAQSLGIDTSEGAHQ